MGRCCSLLEWRGRSGHAQRVAAVATGQHMGVCYELGPVQNPFRVPLCKALTLNATGQFWVSVSLRQEHLRAACGSLREEKGPETRPNPILAGDLDVVLVPYVAGMVTYQTSDTRKGCPAKAAAHSKLINKTFTLASKSLLMVTGHIIRSAVGRSDLNLHVDNKTADDGLTYTSSKQFADGHVFWTGTVEAGPHNAWLSSPTANAWGCQGNWGENSRLVYQYRHLFVSSSWVAADIF